MYDKQRYEYKYVEIPNKTKFRTKTGEVFEKCKTVIDTESKSGWRLKQIVTPFNEKFGLFAATGYQIIFEREIEP